jgi:hypothetical protein
MSVSSTRVRDLEELVTLQDRAIQALQQASLALSLALSALQQSLEEKGQQNKFKFDPNTHTPNTQWPNALPTITYAIPNQSWKHPAVYNGGGFNGEVPTGRVHVPTID